MHNIIFNTDSVEISDMVQNIKFFVWSWLRSLVPDYHVLVCGVE